jgi:hypothetical protein
MFSRKPLFGGPVKVARVVTQQAARLHWGSIGEWWRGGGRVMGNRFCGCVYGERRRGQECVSEVESERWIGESGLTATNDIGPQHLGPAAGSGPGPLRAGVRDASGRINRLSKDLTRSPGPNHFLDDSTSASAGLQLCRASARDAHRRPPSASIRQHEETGNCRACKLPISACFYFPTTAVWMSWLCQVACCG